MMTPVVHLENQLKNEMREWKIWMHHQICGIEWCKINYQISELWEIGNLGLKESFRFPLDSSKILLHSWIGNIQLQRRIWPRQCDPHGKPWKTTVNLTIFWHGEKLPLQENCKDHGFAPCFCSNHGSTLILKMTKKIQNSDGDTDSAIAFVASRSVETI